MSRRRDTLQKAVDRLNHVHQEWADDPNRPIPDDVYFDSVDELLNIFATGDIPNDCRELSQAVLRFQEEVDRFDNRDNPQNGYPHNGFWEARQELEDLRKSSRTSHVALRPLESVADLDRQGVSHEQIARMYGWVDDLGYGLPSLVKRELEKPGSVKDDKWVDPRLKHLQEQESNYDFDQQQKLTRKRTRHEAEIPVCRETPLELWEQGVSVEQSARMLRLSEEDVADLFEGYDAEAKGRNLEPVGVVDEPLPEDSGNSGTKKAK